MNGARKIRVLVVDDSAIVRRILTDTLSSQPDIEVVGTAPDAYVARDKILTLEPDVLTLDIEMPRMDGVSFLKTLMRHRPMPVIVISSLGVASCDSAIAALREGAVEVLAKPGGPYSVGDLAVSLPQKIRAASAARVARLAAAASPAPPAVVAPAEHTRPRDSAVSLIAIGASTGGTEAVERVLTHLVGTPPGIVIVQHIPAGFSRAFADRLNRVCRFDVREARNGDEVGPGAALVAPGNFHMVVRRSPSGYRVEVRDGPHVCYQRPSVDVLFVSAAEAAGPRAIGVLLTGMGSDGAQGLLKMRRAGAHTIAQDEATSVVFGMPREAVRAGAVEQVLPLDRIAPALSSHSA